MKNSYYFRQFSSKDDKEAIRKGITAALNLVEAPFAEEMGESAEACVRHICKVVESLNDHTIETEWIPAAKRHKDEVARICTHIFQVSKSVGVANPVTEVTPSKISFYDGFHIEEEKIVPRSFWKCYRLFSYLKQTETAEQLTLVLQIITCIFTIYKMLGIEGPKLDERAKDHLREQRSTKLKDNAKSNWLAMVHQFLDHIDRCVLDNETPRSKVAEGYVAAIKIAKKKFQRPKQSRDELPLNTHSSGLSIKGQGTMPSILASAFEGALDDYDNTQFDQIVGYVPSEKLCDLSNSTVRLTRTVFIPHRSKDDVREIHTASSWIQDRMNYHSKVMKSFLRERRSICIWNQMKGVKEIVKAFNISRIGAGYSLDLHAATDTLDRVEQAVVYRHLLRWLDYSESEIETLSDHWLHYASIKLNVLLPYSKKYLEHEMATGQPMGFESSVYSLNLSHDLWAVALIDYCEINHNLQSVCLEILGDDFFVAFKADPEMVFPSMYQELMAELNTECNLSKGYIYNKDQPEYKTPIAEFAKNLVCDGVNITPLPLGALALCDTPQGIYSFLTWYKERMEIKQIDLDYLASFLPDDGDIISLLCCLPVKNQFRALTWERSVLPTFRLRDYRVLLAIAIPFIREFLMLDIINELNDNPDYTPRVTDYTSFTKKWRRYSRMIWRAKDKLPNNKLVALVDRLELTAIAQSVSLFDISEGILPYESPEDGILDLLPSLKKLDDENLPRLLELFDLMKQLKDQNFNDNIELSDEVVWSLTNSLNELQLADFNPTAQRFGVQKENITAGFDFSWLREESQRMMNLLNISTEEVNDTLAYLHDINKTRVYYTWKTEVIDENNQNPETDSDVWKDLELDSLFF